MVEEVVFCEVVEVVLVFVDDEDELSQKIPAYWQAMLAICASAGVGPMSIAMSIAKMHIFMSLRAFCGLLSRPKVRDDPRPIVRNSNKI